MIQSHENRPKGQEFWHDPFPADIHVMGSVLEEVFYKVCIVIS